MQGEWKGSVSREEEEEEHRIMGRVLDVGGRRGIRVREGVIKEEGRCIGVREAILNQGERRSVNQEGKLDVGIGEGV